jgi:hypothetical protein
MCFSPLKTTGAQTGQNIRFMVVIGCNGLHQTSGDVSKSTAHFPYVEVISRFSTLQQC